MLKNAIVKLTAFCLLLVVARILRTGHFSFVFLFWNLFLAWVPYFIVLQYRQHHHWLRRAIILAGTLLFLPNAPYILTDLFHLTKKLVAPMWFDLVLIYSFSFLGLLFFLLTLERFFDALRPHFARQWVYMSTRLLVFLANGYGIYAGRYLRLNSWDVVHQPGLLVRRMFDSVFDAGDGKETLAITVTFSILLYLIFGIYETLLLRAQQRNNEIF